MTHILVDTANTFFRARHVVRGDSSEKIGMAIHITLNSIKKAWNGEIKMILPTSKNLEQTFDFNSTNELISFYKSKESSEIKSILPKFKKVDGKWEGRLPDDEGYEDF